MTTVYVSTSSDILHEGILNVIDRASGLGDVVVGVLSDEVIATYKRPPMIDFDCRKRMYGALSKVSRVVEQRSLSYREVLEKVRPDFVLHGDDWRTGFQSSIRQEVIDTLAQWDGELVEIPYTKGVSASSLEENIRMLRMSPDMRRGSLRKLLGLKPYLRVIEASNGLSGLIAETASVQGRETGEIRTFDGMWVSSLCDSTLKGKPDIELVDFTSRLQTIEEIMEVTTKPIILDGDTGGKPEHFAHNVRTLERIGVSAIIVEDKTGLKRNSLFGTEVPQLQEDPHIFAEKLAAGKKSLRTRDFMIVARIESLIAKAGIEDALRRADIYIEEGGADGIMIHSKERDAAEVTEFMRRFRLKWPDVPVVLVPTTYNSMTERELADRGANVIIYANHLLRSAYSAMERTARTILENGRSLEADDLCAPIKTVLTLIPED